uniref:Methyltransferase type 11 domain-containing protein n=1 Tax=Haptolina brevifila TaxID=156173 RepID=A0A7S2GU10_9EUKA
MPPVSELCTHLVGPLCTAIPATQGPLPAHLRRSWQSSDPLLRQHRIRYLQLGGDTWNRCGPGWLNVDANYDVGDGAPSANVIATDDTDRKIMRHEVSAHSRLPFANNSFQLVYSEHMLEHMLPVKGGGVNFLSEAYRVLVPGGVLRIVTPDLAKYVCSFVEPSNTFLERHGERFQPMQLLGNAKGGITRAGVFNNIFRNYGHMWIYDFDELRHAVHTAGIDPSLACRSSRNGRGMPPWASQVLRRANEPRNSTQTCWLDQAVRKDESMYVLLIKPLV